MLILSESLESFEEELPLWVKEAVVWWCQPALSWCSVLLSVSSANLYWQVTIYSGSPYSLSNSSTAALDNVVLIHLKESHDTLAEAGSVFPTSLSSLSSLGNIEFCCSKANKPRKGSGLFYHWEGKQGRAMEIEFDFPTTSRKTGEVRTVTAAAGKVL